MPDGVKPQAGATSSTHTNSLASSKKAPLYSSFPADQEVSLPLTRYTQRLASSLLSIPTQVQCSMNYHMGQYSRAWINCYDVVKKHGNNCNQWCKQSKKSREIGKSSSSFMYHNNPIQFEDELFGCLK